MDLAERGSVHSIFAPRFSEKSARPPSCVKPFKNSAPPRTAVGNSKQIANAGMKFVSSLLFTIQLLAMALWTNLEAVSNRAVGIDSTWVGFFIDWRAAILFEEPHWSQNRYRHHREVFIASLLCGGFVAPLPISGRVHYAIASIAEGSMRCCQNPRAFIAFIENNNIPGLKVGGNEKNGGSGRSQMLDNGLGPWRSRFIFNLNKQFLSKMSYLRFRL